MKEKRRFILLFLIMAVISLSVGSTVILILYNASIEQQKERLVETVNIQAKLIEAIALYNQNQYHASDRDNHALISTLDVVVNANHQSEKVGKTGELFIAKHEHEQIVILFSHRHHNETEALPEVPYAEPMKQALLGHSGSMIGIDNNGIEVLAAYAHVPIINYGIVAKIDLYDIRKPFIQASIICGIATFVLIIVGAVLFFKISDPILKVVMRKQEELESTVELRTKELKLSNERLRETQTRFQEILDHSPTIIYLKNSQGKYILINQKFINLLHCAEGHIIGKTAYDFFPEQFAETLHQNDEEVFRNRQALEREEQIPQDDSVHTYLSIKFPLYDQKKEVFAVCSISTDITSIKKTHAQLIQSSKLAAIGELATGIAHELSQPLMFIRTHAQLESRAGVNGINALSAYDTLKDIEDGTGRMMKIINHLKDFARQTDFDLTPLDLHEVLERSFTLFYEQFRVRKITILKDYEQELPEILGNANQLEQVFVNCLSNARDAVEGKSEAQIEVSTSIFQSEEGSKSVVVCFKDNGKGISAVHLNSVFDPFFTTKEVGKGTGLGLSISYGIIQEHQGSITIMSQEGHGTTVNILLPPLTNLPEK
ncbi:ATP-binding protein [Deltaproteobacteria bacterium TL4]